MALLMPQQQAVLKLKHFAWLFWRFNRRPTNENFMSQEFTFILLWFPFDNGLSPITSSSAIKIISNFDMCTSFSLRISYEVVAGKICVVAKHTCQFLMEEHNVWLKGSSWQQEINATVEKVGGVRGLFRKARQAWLLKIFGVAASKESFPNTDLKY